MSVPVIDGVNWNDFGINPVYAKDSHSRGLFEWGMLYKEGNVPTKEEKRRSHHSEPYYAPTHAGGLFAINREYFKELGWYDPGRYRGVAYILAIFLEFIIIFLYDGMKSNLLLIQFFLNSYVTISSRRSSS